MSEDVTRPTNDATSPTSVLIISEVRLLREALAHVVEHDTALSVCGLSFEPMEALPTALNRQPDVVLLDASFPEGMAVVGRLRCIAPQIRVIVLAVRETEQNIIAWAEAGMAGYIPNTAGLGNISILIRDIIEGKQSCSEPVAAGMLRRIRRTSVLEEVHRNNLPAPLPLLTSREVQIVDLIASGMSNKEISRRLNIGISTTKTHVHHLLGKLALQRRGQLAQRVGQASNPRR